MSKKTSVHSIVQSKSISRLYSLIAKATVTTNSTDINYLLNLIIKFTVVCVLSLAFYAMYEVNLLLQFCMYNVDGGPQTYIIKSDTVNMIKFQNSRNNSQGILFTITIGMIIDV